MDPGGSCVFKSAPGDWYAARLGTVGRTNLASLESSVNTEFVDLLRHLKIPPKSLAFGKPAAPRGYLSLDAVASGLPLGVILEDLLGVSFSLWPPELPTVWKHGSYSCGHTEVTLVGRLSEISSMTLKDSFVAAVPGVSLRKFPS